MTAGILIKKRCRSVSYTFNPQPLGVCFFVQMFFKILQRPHNKGEQAGY